MARVAYQRIDVTGVVALIQLLARRPVVGDFVVIPLPDLRHLGVEAPYVVVHQVIAVGPAIVVQRLGDLALGFGGDVAPDAPVLGGQGFGHRAVGVDGVAAVDKKVRQAQAHGFIDAHAADVRVDAKALADGVAAPHEAYIATLGRRAAQVAEPWLAAHATLGIFELHAIKNGLIGR